MTILVESERDLLIDMVVKKFILKKSNYALVPFYLRTQNRYRTTQNMNYFFTV